MSSFQKTFNNTIIDVSVDDISEKECDAIIIPSNSRLLPAGELRCQVLRAAGAKVQVECNTIINKKGQIPDGEAIITSAGALKTKSIIHVVGPKMARRPETKKLMHATWNGLKKADENKLKTVAITSISNRVYLFTPKICSNIMVPTIIKFVLELNEHLTNIHVIMENEKELQAFSDKLEEIE